MKLVFNSLLPKLVSVLFLAPVLYLVLNKLSNYMPQNILFLVGILMFILVWLILSLCLYLLSHKMAKAWRTLIALILPFSLFIFRIPPISSYVPVSPAAILSGVLLCTLITLTLAGFSLYEHKPGWFPNLRLSKLSILFLILGFWLVLALSTQAFGAGYHFTDDHEIIRISHDLQNSDLFTVMNDWITSDFALRFRPMFYVVRIFLVWLSSANTYILGFINFALLILTNLALYKTLRNLRLSKAQSFLFPLLILVGTQTEIWWRLGVNETPAMVFFALSLLSLTTAIYRGRRYKIAGVIFMILAALSKESFTILIPAYMLFMLLVELKYKDLKFLKAIKKNLVYFILLGITFFASIWFILGVVGTNTIGYAGVEGSSFSVLKLAKTSLAFITPEQILLISLLGLITIVYSLFSKHSSDKLKMILLNLFSFVGFLVVFVLLPQSILYAKSGVVPRYLIPGVFFLAALIVGIWYILRSIHKPNYRLISVIITLLITILSIPTLQQMYIAAGSFALQGIQTQTALDTIKEQVSQEERVLIVAEPAANFEWTYSLEKYLSQKLGMKNIYIAQIILPQTETNDFNAGLARIFLNQFQEEQRITGDIPLDDYSTIIVFNEILNEFRSTYNTANIQVKEIYANTLLTVYY